MSGGGGGSQRTKVRTYKLRLYPTPAQATALEEQLAFACELYNAALQERRQIYERADRWRDGKGKDGAKGKLVREWRVRDETGMWRWTTDEPMKIGFADQSRNLTQYRRTSDFPEGMAARVQHDVLRRVDKAYQAFFEGLKQGRRSGPPRYRSRRRYNSMTFQLTAPSPERFDENGNSLGRGVTNGAGYIRDGVLYLTGLGSFPILLRPRRRGRQQATRVAGLRMHRPFPDDAIPRTVTVSRSCERWYACVSLEVPHEPPVHTGPDVGIDLGIVTWATLYSEDADVLAAVNADLGRQDPVVRRDRDATSIRIDGVKAAERHARLVLQHQRTVSRRTKQGHSHSHRRTKAVRLYARAKEAERNLRADHRHKVTKVIARHFGQIAMEDLGVQDMTRAPKHEPDREGPARLKEDLNRRIQDAAWYEFRLVTTYKAEDAGGSVVTVPPEYTTQTCSTCGQLVPKPPSLRMHHCPNCGFTAPRTVNAARNVLLRARAGVQQERPDGAHPSGHNGSGRGLRTSPSPRASQ